MGLPYLTKCFCLSLRTGTILVGFLNVATGLLNTVSFLESTIYHAGKHEITDSQYYSLFRMLTFYYADALQTIFAVFVVFGAFKDIPYKRCYILPWLLFHCLEAFHIASHIMCDKHPILHLLEELIFIGIYAGLVFVVVSYYHTLPEQRIMSS